jgi:phospholipid/cholesterol/gamma-HCH transport system permease protein
VIPWAAVNAAPLPPTVTPPDADARGRASRGNATAAAVGAAFLGIAETTGGMAILLGGIVRRMVSLKPQIDRQELRRNLYKMAVKSLPIVVVTALFTGAIMVIQAAP